MKLIIAEKPSVARSIAGVLGIDKKENGYLTGKEYVVSWCIGHLVELAPAHLYDERYAKWRMEDIPILPDQWQYVICDATQKQYAVLKRLMNDPKIQTVICATDAGREGELIFRMVYQQCGCSKPVQRLWISSLEDSAIRKGMQNLHEGSEYDNLYRAALCRAQADWLVGINASRLFSLMYGATLNVGRVMSPTLAMIVSREASIAAFQPEPFYSVQISCGFLAQTERIRDKAEAERIRQACHLQQAVVKSIERTRKTEKSPRLYDLTTLQRDANRTFGFTAQQTLDYAQSLYEKRLLTYPRTDSRFLTEDMEQMLPRLVSAVASALPYAAGLSLPVHFGQVADDGKVSDHHAIIPTQSMAHADLTALPVGERDILNLVAVRLLCAVGDPYRYEEVMVTLECAGWDFLAKGKNVLSMGWQTFEATFRGSLGGRVRENGEKEALIPPLCEGQRVGPVVAMLKEGKTSPPKRYTEDTLLAAMETAGANEAPEDAERKGLGTPATRAGILEKLVQAGYVERKGEKRTQNLIPTEKGNAIIDVLPESLRSPMLTAEWEQRLKRIERGEETPQRFIGDICLMLEMLTQTASPVKGIRMPDSLQRNAVGICPHCGMTVRETPRGFFCVNRGCRFGVWKDNRFFADNGISLTPKIMRTFLRDGRVHLKGLRSRKSGACYEATLNLECQPDGLPRFRLEFDETSKERKST